MERNAVSFPVQDLNPPVRVGHPDGSTGELQHLFYSLLCHASPIVLHGKTDIFFIGFRTDFQDSFLLGILKTMDNGIFNQRL